MACLLEGDILLLLGSRLVSNVICCLSGGYSHIAMVLEFDGRLYACHSTPNPASVVSLFGDVHSGVMATLIDDMVGSNMYTCIDVYRSSMIRKSAIENAKDIFIDSYGKPFEKNCMAMVCALCECCPIVTDNSIFCSELVGKMMTQLSPENPHMTLPSSFIDIDGMRIVGHLALPPPGCWLCNFSEVAAKPLSMDEAARRRKVLRQRHLKTNMAIHRP